MSVKLLRVLAQALPQTDWAAFADTAETGGNILPQLFAQGLIAPQQLADLLAERFHLPLYDLADADRNAWPADVLDETDILQLRCLPVAQNAHTLTLAVADPTVLPQLQKALFADGREIALRIVRGDHLEEALQWLAARHNKLLQEMKQTELPETAAAVPDETQEDGPVARFVQKILEDAVRSGASDIHFEFYEQSARVRLRVDGRLHEAVRPPLHLGRRIASRIKIMADLDIAEKRVPQDGRTQIRTAEGAAVDFRVSTLPCLFGEKIVLRVLNAAAGCLKIGDLGLEDFQLDMLQQAIARPHGMILVTGPTGSGKTVSLYACLNLLNTENVNIATAENPAEINLAGINQVNVNEKQGLTFAAALRAFLRQDPDIIMVGEIRDLETADTAVKAAQTGHLVFSTLHTNNAPATLSRLLNMGVAPFNIAASVSLIAAQRLVRCLCPHCKTPAPKLPETALTAVGFTAADLAQNWRLYRAAGCDACQGKGYRGRTGIYEVMPLSEQMKAAIVRHGTEADLARIAYAEGLTGLRRAGLLKVMRGITSLEEILAATEAA